MNGPTKRLSEPASGFGSVWPLAEQDTFINEVTDEVRRDRLYTLMRRYGWIGILAIVVLVGGAGFNEWRSAQARSAAEARGDAVIASLDAETPEARIAAIGDVATGETGDLAAVLSMLAAGQATEDEGRDAARSRLDGLAEDPDIAPVYRDLAILKSVALGASETAPEARLTRLEPLTRAGAPFRVLALELIAYAHIDAGDSDQAVEILRDLTQDAEASQGLRQRASQMIIALGGSLETADG